MLSHHRIRFYDHPALSTSFNVFLETTPRTLWVMMRGFWLVYLIIWLVYLSSKTVTIEQKGNKKIIQGGRVSANLDAIFTGGYGRFSEIRGCGTWAVIDVSGVNGLIGVLFTVYWYWDSLNRWLLNRGSTVVIFIALWLRSHLFCLDTVAGVYLVYHLSLPHSPPSLPLIQRQWVR